MTGSPGQREHMVTWFPLEHGEATFPGSPSHLKREPRASNVGSKGANLPNPRLTD